MKAYLLSLRGVEDLRGPSARRGSAVDGAATSDLLHRIAETRSPSAALLNSLLMADLAAYASSDQSEAVGDRKPIVLNLSPPFGCTVPASVALFAFKATQHASERQRGTFKIQLTHVARSGYHKFSREDGWPFLVGVVPELACFIIWDATMYDRGLGFTYSRSVQVSQAVVRRAVLTGVGVGSRQIRVGGLAIDRPVAVPCGSLIKGLGLAYSKIIDRLASE